MLHFNVQSIFIYQTRISNQIYIHCVKKLKLHCQSKKAIQLYYQQNNCFLNTLYQATDSPDEWAGWRRRRGQGGGGAGGGHCPHNNHPLLEEEQAARLFFFH